MIGLWTCSSPAPAEDFKGGLESLGTYTDELILSEECLRWATRAAPKGLPFLAGTDKGKCRSFLSLWRNERVSDILAVRGGYGILRLLPHLASEKSLRKPQKKLWGYSDLTTMQMALWGWNEGPWVHSPMLTSTSLRSPRPVESKIWRHAFGHGDLKTSVQEHRLRIFHRPQRKTSSWSLPLVGGNLACLTSLMGTPWVPPARPCLLFLEDLKEAPYRLDRMLQQLSAARFFRGVKGIVLGHFTDCGQWAPVLRHWAHERDLLLVSGLKAGHDRPNLPLLMGQRVHLELESQKTANLTVPKPRFG